MLLALLLLLPQQPSAPTPRPSDSLGPTIDDRGWPVVENPPAVGIETAPASPRRNLAPQRSAPSAPQATLAPAFESAFATIGTPRAFRALGGISAWWRITVHGPQGETIAIREVTRTIEDRYKKSQNITVESTQEFKRKILALSQESFRLFDVLGLIGIVVAALGVINTLMMNVLERQREIGALRSLGLTRWQTIKMILAEAAAFGVIGGVFGLGFGFVLSQVFVRALNAMSGYDLKFVFNPPTFLAGVFIALGVSQAAAIYPAVKAAGVNIVEAIKHE